MLTRAVFEGINCTLAVERPAPGVVVVVIAGPDRGELGSEPFRELAKDLERGPFQLFIDAQNTRGASIDVSNDWAQWLREHRDELHRVHMLTATRFVQLTADFARRFAGLGDKMRIYTDREAFEEALAAAATRH